MASGDVTFGTIAGDAFRAARRRPLAYVIIAALVVLVIALLTMQMKAARAAAGVGMYAMVTSTYNECVIQVFNLCTYTSMLLAAYLGAVALSAPITGKSSANARNGAIGPTTYLAGRWLGTLAFLWIFQCVGLAVAIGIARTLAVQHTPLLWLGFARGFVWTVLSSGVSLGLSAIMPPLAAGIVAFLLPMVPDLASDQFENARAIVGALARAVYYLVPATMPVDPLYESFSKELISPAYVLYSQVLAENVLYAMVVLVIVGALFPQRVMRRR